MIAVKYCGGCNSHYNRVEFIQALQRDFQQWEIVGPDATDPDFVLVVCGCPAKCVSHGYLAGRQGKFVVASPEDRDLLYGVLKSCLPVYDGRVPETVF